MYRRSVFDHLGGFDTTVNPASDYDLYLRIAQKFPIYCHTDCVAEYRRHGENMSSNQMLMLEHLTRVLRSQLKGIGGNKEYEEACRTGLEFYQRLYRIPVIVERMRIAARKRDWSGTLRGMLLLLWSDPRVFTEDNGGQSPRSHFPETAIILPSEMKPAHLVASPRASATVSLCLSGGTSRSNGGTEV